MRWKNRPEGSNWGDFGPDDQIGRLNWLGPEQVRKGAAEIREGRSFCLSMPLDYPGGNLLNPARHPAWGADSFVFFPNFMILTWAPGWYVTYHYWPTAYDRHTFVGTCYFVPPKNARERMRQELATVTFKEFALQDCNTLEATQTMLESRAASEFPICDQEVMIRHLHRSATEYVEAHRAGRAAPHAASSGRLSMVQEGE